MAFEPRVYIEKVKPNKPQINDLKPNRLQIDYYLEQLDIYDRIMTLDSQQYFNLCRTTLLEANISCLNCLKAVGCEQAILKRIRDDLDNFTINIDITDLFKEEIFSDFSDIIYGWQSLLTKYNEMLYQIELRKNTFVSGKKSLVLYSPYRS